MNSTATHDLPAPDPEIPPAAGPGPGPRAVDRWLDWAKLTMTFCLGVAAEMAIQTRTEDPWSFHSLCLLLMLAFSAVFVSTNVAHKHANAARLLESIATLFGITGFFLATTVALPLALKLVSWLIYALNLLSVILVCFVL